MICGVRHAALLAGLCALLAIAPARAADAGAACAAASLSNPEAATGGMGGTGTVVNNSSGGMGGTGAVAGSGGMGGTGIMAQATQLAPGTGGMGGTGIVGIITGFASICVNGVEVHYDARTPVSINGQAASTGELAVGHYVVVHAGTVGGQLRAIGIGAIDAVRGTVTGVDPGARTIQVLGQNVRLDNAVGQDIGALKTGASVRVSGLRASDGMIVASRIDTVQATAQASLLGTVSSVNGNTAVVNGTRIALPERTAAQPLARGAEVFVAGDWKGNVLQASRVEVQPVRDAIARTDRTFVEGYVTRRQGAEVSIGSIAVQLSNNVTFSGGNAGDAEVGRKVQVEVRRSGDRWIADRVRMSRSTGSGSEGRPGTTGTPDGTRGNQDTHSGPDGGSRSGGGANSGSSETSGTSSNSSGSSGSGSSGSSSSNSGSSGSNSGSSGTSGSRSGTPGSSGNTTSGGSISGGSRQGGAATSGSGRSSGSSGGSGSSRR